MRTILFVILMLTAGFANSARFEVAKDGEVGAYFVGATAAYENQLSITFDSNPLEITPFINNHTASFAEYTSYGSRLAGDGVHFHDFVTDTFDLWSNDIAKNYDGFDHMFYSAFMLPSGIPALFVGFEDLTGGGGRDYDDIMAIFVNISPVPEPETYLMFMLGLAALAIRGCIARLKSHVRIS